MEKSVSKMQKNVSKLAKVGNIFKIERVQESNYSETDLRDLKARLKGDLLQCAFQRNKLDDWEAEINDLLSQIDAALPAEIIKGT